MASQRTGRGSGLWRNRDFMLLWSGQSVSEAGSAVTVLVLPLVAITTLHASLLAADRMPRRALMIWCDILRAVLLFLVPVMAVAGLLSVSILYAVALLSGALSVFFTMAYTSILPSLVATENLVDGNGKLQATRSFAQIAGAGIGGTLASILGPAGAVTVDAASYLASVGTLAFIRQREPPRERQPGRRVGAEILEGLRYTWRHAILRALVLSGGTSLLFSSMTTALFVLFLVRDLHAPAYLVGVVSIMSGIGGVLGGMFAQRIALRVGSARVIWLSKFCFSGAFALLPLAWPGWGVLFAGASSMVGNAGVVVFNTAQISYRQAQCPPRLLGRLNASFRWIM